MTTSKTSSGIERAQPSVTASELDSLDQELGKDSVKDVLGNYFDDETESVVKELIHANPGLTGSEPTEAMDVNTRPPLESVVDTQDQPMETAQSEPYLGTFQPELGTPAYTLSLIRSANSTLSPIMANDNALLDTDPDAPGLS